ENSTRAMSSRSAASSSAVMKSSRYRKPSGASAPKSGPRVDDTPQSVTRPPLKAPGADRCRVGSGKPQVEAHADPPGILRNADELFGVDVGALVDVAIAPVEGVF